MRLATWNVNSIKARLPAVMEWLKEATPDVVCLQETKTPDEAFPSLEFQSLGYNCAVHGQKSYNGVAILSKRPLEDVSPRLPGGHGDDHCRYIEAVVSAENGAVRVAAIYAPNGNPIGTDKFAYKLAWMERLARHAESLISLEEPLALMGDMNVIPGPKDCYDPKAWEMDALFQPESRAALRRVEFLGFTDAFRACHAESSQYTFWDYQAGCWQKNRGIRIDHILLSPQATDGLKGCRIDKHVRGRDRPSDHVPVWCELAV
ncbi:MAG TPA: exodeoxyribonuclease III [Rhizomicrobium sp.]|jgi:exodeoxyribonuclease-3|nr:exodeoxyribonuclease III [Rhizomicrobium sp.]